MTRRAYLPLLLLVPVLCACAGLTGIVGTNPASSPDLGKRVTLIVIARNTSDHMRDGIAPEIILQKKLGHTVEITRFEFRNENGDRVVAAPAGFVTKPYYECNYDYHPNNDKNTSFDTIFLCSEDLPVGTRFNNFKLLGYIFGKYEALPTEGAGNKDLAWNTLLATGVWEATAVVP